STNGVRDFSISIRARSRSIARSTAWSIVAGATETGVVLADGAASSGPASPPQEAGLDGAADSKVPAVAGRTDGFTDCCALALHVSSNEVVITQHAIRITHPRFRFLSSSSISKGSGSVWRLWSLPPALFSGRVSLDGSYRC